MIKTITTACTRRDNRSARRSRGWPAAIAALSVGVVLLLVGASLVLHDDATWLQQPTTLAS